MKNLFVPYELAILLKDKGFKENCLGFYSSSANSGDNNFSQFWSARLLEQDTHNPDFVEFLDLTNDKSCLAPLYQQAITWLKEKHKIYIYEVPYPYEDRTEYHITFKDEHGGWCDVDVKDINEAIEQSLKTIK